MPTYRYRCTVCKTEFDAFQSMMDEPLSACTDCKEPVIRIIQPVGIAFKGSGFYINDSSSSASNSTASTSSTKPNDTTTTTETKSTSSTEPSSKPAPSNRE